MEHTQHVQVIIFQSTHVLWKRELSVSTTFVQKFCVPLGSPKNLCSAFWVNLDDHLRNLWNTKI